MQVSTVFSLVTGLFWLLFFYRTLSSAEAWKGAFATPKAQRARSTRKREKKEGMRQTGMRREKRMPSSGCALIAPLARQISKISNSYQNIKPLRRRVFTGVDRLLLQITVLFCIYVFSMTRPLFKAILKFCTANNLFSIIQDVQFILFLRLHLYIVASLKFRMHSHDDGTFWKRWKIRRMGRPFTRKPHIFAGRFWKR